MFAGAASASVFWGIISDIALSVNPWLCLPVFVVTLLFLYGIIFLWEKFLGVLAAQRQKKAGVSSSGAHFEVGEPDALTDEEEMVQSGTM